MFQVKMGLAEWLGWYRADSTYVMGTVMDISADTAMLAETAKRITACTGHYLGFLMHNITATGRSFIQKETGVPTNDKRVEQYVSIRQGPGKIITDVVAGYGETGDMSAGVHDDHVSAFNGKLRVFQEGDIALGRLIGTWSSVAVPTAYYIQIF